MKKITLFSIIVPILILLFSGNSLVADEMMVVTGTVNDYYQVVTDDGEIYVIGDTDKGMELDQHSGSRVEVFGTINSEDDEKTIMVSDYKIVATDS